MDGPQDSMWLVSSHSMVTEKSQGVAVNLNPRRSSRSGCGAGMLTTQPPPPPRHHTLKKFYTLPPFCSLLRFPTLFFLIFISLLLPFLYFIFLLLILYSFSESFKHFFVSKCLFHIDLSYTSNFVSDIYDLPNVR